MKLSAVLQMRLLNQQLLTTSFKTPKEIVSWMGAIQAQEYLLSKWAIGIRLPGISEKQIDKAIDRGDILRTHILRPTWHYVAPEDIHWMLALSAINIKAASKSRHKQLEFTEAIFKKSNKIIEKALSNGEHLTRPELVALLNKAKINANAERGGHLLSRAEQDGIITSGANKGSQITYALLASRVSTGKSFSREEASAKLAQRYFASHGPATVQDFIWWSGLSITEGKKALDSVKEQFESITIKKQTFWFAPVASNTSPKNSGCYLMAPYDEYVIAYTDRSILLSPEADVIEFQQYGLFRATIIVNGKCVGLWKRTIKKDLTVVETKFFKPPSKSMMTQVKKAAKDFGKFIEQKVTVTMIN